MQAKRVLVQWLPTQQLRTERFLTLGSNYTGEVQQTGVEMHDPEFALALVLAQGRCNGYPQLQVGFACGTRPTSEGWVLTAPADPGWHYFDATPTKAALVDAALAAQGGMTPELETRVEATRHLVEQLRQTHAEQTVEQARAVTVRTQAAEAAVDHALTARLATKKVSTGPGMREAVVDESEGLGDVFYDTSASPNWQWRRDADSPAVDTGVPVVPGDPVPVSAILVAVSDRLI